jgi:hypothetical protein
MNIMQIKSARKTAVWFFRRAEHETNPFKRKTNYTLAAKYFREAGEIEHAERCEIQAQNTEWNYSDMHAAVEGRQ